jgi:hypothetical protein
MKSDEWEDVASRDPRGATTRWTPGGGLDAVE